jgi:hypothetical protein
MHAVVVRVTIGDLEAATQFLRSEIVPRVSAAPGFVAGYWTQASESGGDNGMSMIVFESEDAARGAAEAIRSGPMPEAVTIESIEVRQVVANA